MAKLKKKNISSKKVKKIKPKRGKVSTSSKTKSKIAVSKKTKIKVQKRSGPKVKKMTIKERNDKIFKSEVINEKLSPMLDENGFKLIRVLMEKRKMSEFKLSEVIGIKVNKIRSILYKLQSKKIVEFSKRRDKRKGWYIYTWELKPRNIVLAVIKDLKSDIDILEKKYHVRQEGKEFFSCNECGIQTNMLKALETNYLCPYCESPMKVVDVEGIKKDIVGEIDKIKDKINSIEELK